MHPVADPNCSFPTDSLITLTGPGRALTLLFKVEHCNGGVASAVGAHNRGFDPRRASKGAPVP
jgi:hypothetical protein